MGKGRQRRIVLLAVLLLLFLGGLGMMEKVRAQVVISELLINPVTSGNTDEWIELENIGSEAVFLGGYILDDVVEGGSAPYMLLEVMIEPAMRVVMEYRETKIGLNDTGDSVSLKNSSGITVDQVSYDDNVGKLEGMTWSRTVGLDGTVSYTSTEPTKGLANGHGGENFAPVSRASPSPTTTRFVWPQGLVLSEIRACPGEGETEWIEIHNNSNTDVVEARASLKDKTDNTKALTISARSREYQVFEWANGFLNNSGDSARLFDANGALIDEVAYDVCSTNSSLALIDGNWKETVQLTKGTINRFEPKPVTLNTRQIALNNTLEPSSLKLAETEATDELVEESLGSGGELLGFVDMGDEHNLATQASRLPYFGRVDTVSGSGAGLLEDSQELFIDAPGLTPRPWLLMGGLSILTGGLVFVLRWAVIRKLFNNTRL